MHDILAHLIGDTSFCERAAPLGAIVPPGPVRPLDDMFEHWRRFTTVRRGARRLAHLEEAGRASADDWRAHRERVPEALRSFGAVVTLLSEHARRLEPLIAPPLDDVIALTATAHHPLHVMLLDTAVSLGYTSEEAGWLFAELKGIGYRPVQLVCAGGVEDLLALLAGISVGEGEGSLRLAGFSRFTGDEATDKRRGSLVMRLREQRVTASVFLPLVIVLTAHAVATHAVHMSTSQPVAPNALARRRVMREAQIKAIEPPPAVGEAMATQKQRAAAAAAQQIEVPDWARLLVEQSADAATVVKAAIERGLERRDAATQQEVTALLSELGRNRASAAEVTRSMTVDVLNQLTR